MRTDGRTADRHDEANSRCSQLYERTLKTTKFIVILSLLLSRNLIFCYFYLQTFCRLVTILCELQL